jgi:RNA recognition motif-containing protein
MLHHLNECFSLVFQEKREALQEEDEEGETPPGATLFVKNLSFDTDDDTLKQVFSKAGHVRRASVAKKKDVKNPGINIASICLLVVCLLLGFLCVFWFFVFFFFKRKKKIRLDQSECKAYSSPSGHKTAVRPSIARLSYGCIIPRRRDVKH